LFGYLRLGLAALAKPRHAFPRGCGMRGLENIVGAVIVLGLVVSLTAAASLLVTRLVYTGMHAINSVAMSAVPPRTELVPLADQCSSGALPVEVRIPGYMGRFSVVLYDLSGSIVGAYDGANGSAFISLPCGRDVVVTVNTSSGGFWVYRYDLDPGKYCLAGYVVNASAVLRRCDSYAGFGINASSPAMLQPVWVRSILVSGRGVLQLLERYGPLPGLVVNESETSYTLVGARSNYSIRYVPIPSASAYEGYIDELGGTGLNLSYPVYCKPLIGCNYTEEVIRTSAPEDYSNVTMHIEYEDAVLLIGKSPANTLSNEFSEPGWIYLRDYRVVFPFTANLIRDSSNNFGLGWTYEWRIVANLSPPFFVARIYSSQSRGQYSTGWHCITSKSISVIYSRPIDILLVPLIVSRYTQSFTISFGVIPVSYTAAGRLYWSLSPSYTLKSYGPASNSPQYVALYAYLVPLSEWRPGIPVVDNVARLIGLRSGLAVRALYGKALLNLTKVGNSAFGVTVTINPGEFFEKSGLIDDAAVLALELVITTNGRAILVDTTNNTNELGQHIFCHGVALVSGIHDYIHLSILPAMAQTSNAQWLVMVPGEGVTKYHGDVYKLASISFPRIFDKDLEFRSNSYSSSYDVQVFWANVSTASSDLLAVPAANAQYFVQNAEAVTTPKGSISLSIGSFVSAETIWEKVLQKGREALIVK